MTVQYVVAFLYNFHPNAANLCNILIFEWNSCVFSAKILFTAHANVKTCYTFVQGKVQFTLSALIHLRGGLRVLHSR